MHTQHKELLKIVHKQYEKLKTSLEHKGGGFNKNKPYLFVLGCVMDRQIKADKAWQIPKDIEKYFKVNNFEQLQQVLPAEIKKYFIEKKPHRFNDKMADCFNEAVKKVHIQYKNDASLIWKGVQSAATVIYRFLEFKGVGLKIATMAVNLLDQENLFSENFDRSAIDISPDRHVQRVMTRLGLVDESPSVSQIIFKAKEIYPPFPGLLDLPFYDVGKKYCHAREPQCSSCPFYLHCDYGKNVKIV
ncbi:MAG: hypothetical protein OXH36_03280 [Bdellovibrionales bacterium]|nr:hypothetical protein [Bdellovibrionales bacterium]